MPSINVYGLWFEPTAILSMSLFLFLTISSIAGSGNAGEVGQTIREVEELFEKRKAEKKSEPKTYAVATYLKEYLQKWVTWLICQLSFPSDSKCCMIK